MMRVVMNSKYHIVKYEEKNIREHTLCHSDYGFHWWEWQWKWWWCWCMYDSDSVTSIAYFCVWTFSHHSLSTAPSLIPLPFLFFSANIFATHKCSWFQQFSTQARGMHKYINNFTLLLHLKLDAFRHHFTHVTLIIRYSHARTHSHTETKNREITSHILIDIVFQKLWRDR